MERNMVKLSLMTAGAVGLALIAGCSSSSRSPADRAGAKLSSGDSAQGAAAIERLKKLEGEWDLISDDGKRGPGLVIRVTASGSAVREIMFPGSPHEMTNMYHADGGSVIMTHYCTVGNQPRLRAAGAGEWVEGQPLLFQLDSVTNLGGRDDTYMGRLVLTIVDANTIRQDWNHFTLNGGMSPDPTSMTFKRQGT